jgi:hypothetical protein
MKINQVLVESAGATVAFAFGRFNPAHQGHIEVWRAVEQAGANWFIGTNPSTLGPNDPLTFQQKSAWMTEIYPAIAGHIVAEQSVLTLAAYIFKKVRKNESATVAYITDAADWAWSGKLLNQYNGVEGAHGYYKFAQIIHEPSPRVSSATALRDAARADDKVAFYHASGTDPKSKVAGLTYFDTVKQAVEKYPLPVKRGQKVKEQGVAEGQLDELAGYGSEKGYTKLDSYKRYDVYVSKQKFNNLYYIAVAENPRSLTAKFKAKGKNPQEAVQNLYAEVDKEIDVATKVSGRAIIDFNVDFVRDILELSTDTFYAKIISGPKLVLAGPEMMEYPEIMSSEGFKSSAIRTYKGGEGTTKLPAVPLSTSAAVTANLIANGRYVLGNEEIDKDGNRVFDLEFDSVVQDKNEKLRLRAPALTIGTARMSEETELVESTSLETTLKAIINDISEPVTSTYENLKYLAKKYVRAHGELDRGWNMVAMGPGSKWVEQFYKDKLKNELYDLIRYNSRYTVELQQFLRGVEINGELDVKRSFSNISRELPPILITLGDKLQSPQLVKSAQRWMQNLKDYQMYLASLEDDEEDDYAPTTSTPKSTVPGQQNAQVEKIVNDTLAKLPKNISGEIRNIIARSSNKLQALQQELNSRNITVEETEQQTVAKTWDQMTAQEKSSGVKGRTVWNEKTQRYYTVFDVPVKQETNEASLSTMRDYFAGDDEARDPYEITKQRLHFSKDKNARPTVDKRFRSPEEYQQWLKQNKLRQVSDVQEDEEAGEVEKTGQLIPFPAGTTKVSVSDVYDWYKLGQVISDLDDADPADFGQGAPETVIAFGSEEEEHKLLPLLQRLGLKLKDIDQPVSEAYHAGSLYEMLKKERTKGWSLTNKRKQ